MAGFCPRCRGRDEEVRRDDRGATAIEYALIATLVSIVIVSGATMIGTNLKVSFQQVSSGFSSR